MIRSDLVQISRDAWLRYVETGTGRYWWRHNGSQEYFYEDEDSWTKYYHQEAGRYWWSHGETEKWFYE